MAQTQTDMISNHLKNGSPLTGLDALKMFGCFSLAQRVHELKRSGLNIQKRMIKKNNKHFAEYYIEKTNQVGTAV